MAHFRILGFRITPPPVVPIYQILSMEEREEEEEEAQVPATLLLILGSLPFS